MASRNCQIDIIGRDLSGETLLHRAVSYKEYHFIKFLVESGADINAVDNRGNSPLNNLSQFFRFGGDEYLMNEQNDILMNILMYLISHGAHINHQDHRGFTIFHWASTNYLYEMLEYLLEQGADINTTDHFGDTPLHTAVTDTDYDMVEFLLNHNADIRKNNAGKTPLDLAEEAELDDIVTLLQNYLENLPHIKQPDEHF